MIEIQDLVNAKLYESEEAAWQDALHHLLRSRPELRVRLAIYRYQTDAISLAKAADLAGVSWAQMREILLEQGITPALGPETMAEAQDDVDTLRQHLAHKAP